MNFSRIFFFFTLYLTCILTSTLCQAPVNTYGLKAQFLWRSCSRCALCNQIHTGRLCTTTCRIFPCLFIFVDAFTQAHPVFHPTPVSCCMSTVVYSSTRHLCKNMPSHILQKAWKRKRSCPILHAADLLCCSPWITRSLKPALSFSLASTGTEQVPKCLLFPFCLFSLLFKTAT